MKVKYQDTFLLLSNVYRSPNTPVSFWQDFNILIENASDLVKRDIIVGDINEDQLNINSRYLKNIQLMNNLKNVITETTRVTDTTATLIDPILVSQSRDVFDSGVIEIPNHISDHRATFLYAPFSYIRPNVYKGKVWFYKRADYETLNNMVLNHDWSFIGNNSVDDACKIFTDTMLNFLNLCIPNKEVTIRLNDKPWYDSEIRTLSRKRDRQKAITVSSKNANDWL